MIWLLVSSNYKSSRHFSAVKCIRYQNQYYFVRYILDLLNASKVLSGACSARLTLLSLVCFYQSFVVRMGEP